MAFPLVVMDEQGNAVVGATIEADGVRVGQQYRRCLRWCCQTAFETRAAVPAWKPGYRRKTLIRNPMPDLSLVLEQDR